MAAALKARLTHLFKAWCLNTRLGACLHTRSCVPLASTELPHRHLPILMSPFHHSTSKPDSALSYYRCLGLTETVFNSAVQRPQVGGLIDFELRCRHRGFWQDKTPVTRALEAWQSDRPCGRHVSNVTGINWTDGDGRGLLLYFDVSHVLS